jgi:DNA-binding transcriptional LysR family regulator
MVKVSGLGTANSVGMLAKLSKEGMGIAVLPDFLALHPGFGDGLVRVLNDWEAAPAHVFAVKHETDKIGKIVFSIRS